VYNNCNAKVSVTASDYQFTGIPATLPAGVTTFKMTNSAPQEQHMMAMLKMKPAAQGQDLTKLLSLPEKKQAKYFEQAGGTFAQASPGQVGYAPIKLTPGTYAYACFFPKLPSRTVEATSASGSLASSPAKRWRIVGPRFATYSNALPRS